MKILFSVILWTHFTAVFCKDLNLRYLARLDGKDGEDDTNLRASLVYVSYQMSFKCGGVLVNVNKVVVSSQCVLLFSKKDYPDIHVVDGGNRSHHIEDIQIEKDWFRQEAFLAIITLNHQVQSSEFLSWIKLPKELGRILPYPRDVIIMRWNEIESRRLCSNLQPIIEGPEDISYDRYTMSMGARIRIRNNVKLDQISGTSGGFLVRNGTLIGVAYNTIYSRYPTIIFHYTYAFDHIYFLHGKEKYTCLNYFKRMECGNVCKKS